MLWLPEHDRHLISLREAADEYGWTHEQIAADMSQWFEQSFTKDQISGRLRRLPPLRGLRDLPIIDPMPAFHRHFNRSGRVLYPQPKSGLEEYLSTLRRRNTRYKTLHISDLHLDQENRQLLDFVLRAHGDADLCVVGGDALDIYAYSRFSKDKNHPIEGEIEAWMRLQEFLSRTFAHVLVIDSNHLARVGAALASVPSGLGFLVEPNLLRYLSSPFPNVHVTDDWWVQVHDAVFTHGDGSKGLAPKTALMVHEKLQRFGAVGHIAVQDYHVLVQAHTHACGSVIEGNRKIIESGCLAKLPIDYTINARSVANRRPQVNGYAVVVQKGGRALLNESDYRYLGDLIDTDKSA